MNEIDIISGCKKGKSKCQEQLYKLFYGFAMSIALRYSGNRDEALEIVNDSFMKVFDHITEFNIDQPFKPWLRSILVNTAIDYYRKNAKMQLLNEPPECTELLPDAIDNLNVEDILKLLNELPEVYRITFNLFEIEGYQHEDIAKMMNIAVSTSRSNLTRAKKLLRIAFKKHFQEAYYEAI